MKKVLLFLSLLFFGLHSYTQSCLNDSLDVSTGYNPITGSAAVNNDPRWIITAANQSARDNSVTLNGMALPSNALIMNQVTANHRGSLITYPGTPTNINHRFISWSNNPTTIFNNINNVTNPLDQTATFQRTFRTCVNDTISFRYSIGVDNLLTNFMVDNIQILPNNSAGVNNQNILLPLSAGVHTITITIINTYINTWQNNDWNPASLLLEGFMVSNTGTNSIVQEACYCDNYVCSDSCTDQFWSLHGNLVNPNTYFIGSINNADFKIRTNNLEAAKFTSRQSTGENSRFLLNPSKIWDGGIGSSNFIGINDIQNTQRLRLSAGNQDVQSGTQGASIDLHGNNTFQNKGKLDLVAGSTANGANSAIRFFTNTNATTQSEKMTILGNGDVGINTNPTRKLDVNGSAKIGTVVSNQATVLDVSGGIANQMNITYNNAWGLLLGYGNGTLTNFYHGKDHAALINVRNAPLHLGTNNIQRITILGNGNVGVGTTTPQNSFHIQGGVRVTSLPTTYTSKIVTANTDGDLGSLSFPTSNANGVFLRGDGTWAAAGGGMTSSCTTQFYIPRVNATGSPNLACSQIFDNGTSVGINTTSPRTFFTTSSYSSITGSPSNSTISRLDVNGLTFTNSLVVSSDARLKKDIKKIENALNIVKNLNGVTYVWESEKYKERNLDNLPQAGFLAQELDKVFPNAVVQRNNDGFYAVNYNSIIPVLSNAIKELNIKVEKQYNVIVENEVLKEELTEVKAKLANYDEKFSLLEKSITQLCESGCESLKKIETNSDVDILYQSIPNPTDKEALVNYYLATQNPKAEIRLYTQEGKELETFFLEVKKGNGSIKVNLDGFSQGVYLYSLINGGRVIDTKKIQILK